MITYSIQSIANNKETSFVGRPSAVSTNSMVTNAALGILAAPTLARVAVRLLKTPKQELRSRNQTGFKSINS